MLGWKSLVAYSATAAAVVGGAAALGAGRSPQPVNTPPPSVTALNPAAQRRLNGKALVLAKDSATRHAETMTLRVRNISCDGVATGSGWAIDAHTLVTNRHVLAGAAVLEVNTWDGTSIDGNIDRSATGRLVDVGLASVPEPLPTVAKTGPPARAGERVTAVGYPLGGQLTLSPGKVIRYLDGRKLTPDIAFDGPVMQVSTKIKHGNSGGPLLDSNGRVVGVIYAGEPGATEEDYMRIAYAIPLSSVRTLLRSGGTQAVLPCEQ
jgi:S1-C subfamily serine protease